MRIAKLTCGFYLLAMGPTNADALQAPGCSPEQSVKVEAKVSRANDWGEIYRDFQTLPGCSDENVVEVWEAYSAVISRLFVNDWRSFEAFSSLAARDNHFQEFVIAHISDPTNLQDDSIKIRRHAELECPVRSRELCKRIVAATRE